MSPGSPGGCVKLTSKGTVVCSIALLQTILQLELKDKMHPYAQILTNFSNISQISKTPITEEGPLNPP